MPRPDWERIFSHFKRQMEAEHDEVVTIGGLHILGTERHEARRIDNQLRGRAGRQGDPGSSRFYLSLEDDLMRIFGSDRISGLMQRLGMEEGVPIEHGMVTRAIERAQKQVEAQNFGVRKHLLEYDDVMNKQRESVYTLRREVLEGSIHLTEDEIVNSRDYLMALAEEILEDIVERYAGKQVDVEECDIPAVVREVSRVFGIDPRELEALRTGLQEHRRDYGRRLGDRQGRLRSKGTIHRADLLRRLERDIMLQIVDAQWKDHLYSLDHLKEGIGLRGYGQRDPLVEYKKESYALFQDMKARIEEEIVRYLFWLRPVTMEDRGEQAEPPAALRAPRAVPPRRPAASTMTLNHPGASPVPAFAGAARSNQAAAGADADAGTNWRRRCGQDRQARRAQGWSQRSVPVRERKEIQEVPRASRVRKQRPTIVGLLCI